MRTRKHFKVKIENEVRDLARLEGKSKNRVIYNSLFPFFSFLFLSLYLFLTQTLSLKLDKNGEQETGSEKHIVAIKL